jgi:hypothetical protein
MSKYKEKLIIAIVGFLFFGPIFYAVGHLVMSFLFWEWLEVNYAILRGHIFGGLVMTVCFWFSTDEEGREKK